MPDNNRHVAEQEAFYRQGKHQHLQPKEGDFYARKLTQRLVEQAGIEKHHTVLELGAGFGRFTFHLLDHCESVVALDLSRHCLDVLESVREARDIPQQRCRVHCCNVCEMNPGDLAQDFDFVVGFFVLHHLPDFSSVLCSLSQVLRPNGAMAFLEPNRRNPLFLLQVLCCPDMHWSEEKGMFRLNPGRVEMAFRHADLSDSCVRTLGFFPPQVLNRFAAARIMEERLERVLLLKCFLPFLLMTGRKAFEATS